MHSIEISSRENAKLVEQAFGRQAAIFDELDEVNPVLQWLRGRIRDQVFLWTRSGGNILELNCGTGLDALYFASKGFRIHAIDISGQMIGKLKGKLRNSGMSYAVKAEQLSFTELHSLPAQHYDCIFSNFGGLNCTGDIEAVINNFSKLLKPGGIIALVIMPPVAPWEILTVFKGKFRQAFRRFNKKGTDASVEGIRFKSWYFSPKKLIKKLGPDYKLISLQGLCSIAPPPHKRNFAKRHPGLFHFLTRIEGKVSNKWPFNSWADHYMLVMRYK